MRLVVGLSLIACVLSACRNIESVYPETLKGFVTLLEVVTDVRLYPAQERPHHALLAFLEKEQDRLVSGLDKLASLRQQKPEVFWRLFELHRQDVITVLRRMDAMDKRERLLLGAFSRVFAPREEELEMARYLWDRDMLRTWLELLVKESRLAIR